jgi:hypothetical protein
MLHGTAVPVATINNVDCRDGLAASAPDFLERRAILARKREPVPGARMVRDMAAYHLFRLSRNIAASHGFLSPTHFRREL